MVLPMMAAPAAPVVVIVTVPPLRFSVPLIDVVPVAVSPATRIALPLLVVSVMELFDPKLLCQEKRRQEHVKKIGFTDEVRGFSW